MGDRELNSERDQNSVSHLYQTPAPCVRCPPARLNSGRSSWRRSITRARTGGFCQPAWLSRERPRPYGQRGPLSMMTWTWGVCFPPS